MQVFSTEYREHLIVKHTGVGYDDTYYTVALGGIVYKHSTMSEAIFAIDRWES